MSATVGIVLFFRNSGVPVSGNSGWLVTGVEFSDSGVLWSGVSDRDFF